MDTNSYTKNISSSTVLGLNKLALHLLMANGVEVNRASGSWNMMKTPETTMVEMYNVTLMLNNPLAHWNTTLSRGILLETLDYLLGRNPGYVANWYSIYKEYSAGGEEMPYSYGQRIFGVPSLELNQWELCVEKLKNNPTTRHGWITLHRPLDRTRNFVPCTTDLYFQMNGDKKLDMFTYMRSQDAFRGLPIDLFAWPMFHEQMSLETTIPIGKYYHIVANLHYYKKDEEKLDAVLKAGDCGKTRSADILSLSKKGKISSELNKVDWSKFSDSKLSIDSLVRFFDGEDYWKSYLSLIAPE